MRGMSKIKPSVERGKVHVSWYKKRFSHGRKCLYGLEVESGVHDA